MSEASLKRYQQNRSIARKFHRRMAETLPERPDLSSRTLIGDEATGACRASIRQALGQGMDFLYLLGAGGAVMADAAPEIIQENRGVLVIEPSLERFIDCFTRYDLRPLLRSGRVFWAVGEYARASIEAVWSRHFADAAAKPFVQPADLEVANDEEILALRFFIESELPRRKQARALRLKELPGRLAQRPWRKRPLVWSFSDIRAAAGYSIIQHKLIRTLFHHLREQGVDTRYAVLKRDQYYPPYYRHFDLAESLPDAIFLCNLTPSYDMALGAEFSRALPIPKLTWFADDPLYAEHLLHRRGISGDESFLVADHGWGETLKRHGARRIGFMAGAATSLRRGPQRAQRRCEVVFVGQVRDLRSFFTRLSPAWRDYAERVIEAKVNNPRADVSAVMQRLNPPGDLPHDLMDEFRQHLLWEANTRYRVMMIQALEGYDVHLYGNDAWKALLSEHLSTRWFKGVAPFKRLPELYRNARVTLNIHSLQSYTCLNVRDFDVPAFGGFLLSDWLPHADDVFRPGFVDDLPLRPGALPDVFFYRDVNEMRTLIDYALRHEDERLQCIERARRAVESGHQYSDRARVIAQTLGFTNAL